MRGLRHAAIAIALVAVGACGQPEPLGQVLLFVDTDAPVPPGAGRSLAAGEAPALFDRLSIEVYEPGQSMPCFGCARTFSVDAQAFREKRVSIGIPERVRTPGYRARLRLFSGRSTVTGEPPNYGPDEAPAQSVVEINVTLPIVNVYGVVERTVFMPTDAVGLPIGRDMPVDTTPERPTSTRVGTWPDAKRIPCPSDAPLGEVCVPGGSFWMGNPHSIGSGFGDHADRSRLVVVAPFFMKQTEVTVAEWRAFGGTALPWTGSKTGTKSVDYCTYTPEPSVNEDMPINCVTWEEANAYCKSAGMRLPTEAEFEYAAGGLVSHRYVWGEEVPSCTDSVYGRCGYGIFSDLVAPCRPSTGDAPGGPLAVGTRSPPRRDRLWTGTGTIFDLIGNIGEWAIDEFQQQNGGCWVEGGVYRNPICQNGTKVHTARGGDWRTSGNLVQASTRYGEDPLTQSIVVGFRCVRPL